MSSYRQPFSPTDKIIYAGKRDYTQVRNARHYIRRHNTMIPQRVTGSTENIKKHNPSET